MRNTRKNQESETVLKPSALRFVLTNTPRHTAYSLSGPPTLTHRSAQPCNLVEGDALIAVCAHALAFITPKRETRQLAHLREWTAQENPCYADANTPNPLLLPVTICTCNDELIEAAIFLRGEPSRYVPAGTSPTLADLFQRQLQRFDVNWILLSADNEELAALRPLGSIACVPSPWMLQMNEESQRDYAASQAALLAQLSE